MTRPAQFRGFPLHHGESPRLCPRVLHKAFGFELKKSRLSTLNCATKTKSSCSVKKASYGRTSKSPKSVIPNLPSHSYIYCENVDEFHRNAVECGAKSLGAPEDMFGVTECADFNAPKDTYGHLPQTWEFLATVANIKGFTVINFDIFYYSVR